MHPHDQMCFLPFPELQHKSKLLFSRLLTERDDKLYLTQQDMFGYSCLLFELTMGTLTAQL